jgi:hypothetical protein
MTANVLDVQIHGACPHARYVVWFYPIVRLLFTFCFLVIKFAEQRLKHQIRNAESKNKTHGQPTSFRGAHLDFRLHYQACPSIFSEDTRKDVKEMLLERSKYLKV